VHNWTFLWKNDRKKGEALRGAKRCKREMERKKRRRQLKPEARPEREEAYTTKEVGESYRLAAGFLPLASFHDAITGCLVHIIWPTITVLYI